MEPLIATPEVDPDGRAARVVFNSGVDPIEWAMPPDYGPGFATDGSADFAALAAMPFAMALGRDLHIRGRVCPVLLSNLERLVFNRVAFHAPSFKSVRLSADDRSVVGRYNPSAPHIAAYSGGVDATYCIGRNMHDVSAAIHRPLGASLTIRGYGYDINGSPDFDRARNKASQLGKRFGFKPYALVCNSSNLARKAWGIKGFSPHENAHPMFIAACLNLFSRDYGGGLYAADFSYRDEPDILSWSSNSVVHPLLSSSGFHINAFGADASRSEKLSFLTENGLLSDIVFCGAARTLEKNCGRCRKCRRTIIMCLSRDIDPTDLFMEIPDEGDLIDSVSRKVTEFAFAKSTLRHWTSDGHLTLRLKLWKETQKTAREKVDREMRAMRRKIGPVPEEKAAPPKPPVRKRQCRICRMGRRVAQIIRGRIRGLMQPGRSPL